MHERSPFEAEDVDIVISSINAVLFATDSAGGEEGWEIVEELMQQSDSPVEVAYAAVSTAAAMFMAFTEGPEMAQQILMHMREENLK